MDRLLRKKIASWFSIKTKQKSWEICVCFLVILFYPDSLKSWVREHDLGSFPEFIIYVALLYIFCRAIAYTSLGLVYYLIKLRK
jgi:hypothetical protein